MTPFTVLTVSMPGRHKQLAEAAESLRAQSIGSVPWLIRIEEPEQFGSAHIAYQRNILLQAVETPWVAVLDDDDLFDPDYLGTMARHIDDADVVYSYCRGVKHARGEFDADRLQRENYIDAEACIRTEVLRSVGGWSTDGTVEDWQLWKRLSENGHRFVCVPEELRTHRSGDWRAVVGGEMGEHDG